MWLAPVVLDPLFNRYEDLPQGRTRAGRDRAGAAGRGRCRRRARRRRVTPHHGRERIRRRARARRSGWSCTTRCWSGSIPAQVELVVAHELAHVKQRDLARGMLWVAIVAPPGMYVVMLLTRRWSARAGGRAGSAGVAARAGARAGPGRVRADRRLEPALAGGREPGRRLLAGAHRTSRASSSSWSGGSRLRNVSDPDPPDAYRLVFGTHPTTVERIGIALAFERRPALDD